MGFARPENRLKHPQNHTGVVLRHGWAAAKLQISKQEKYCSKQSTTKIGRGHAAKDENLGVVVLSAYHPLKLVVYDLGFRV